MLAEKMTRRQAILHMFMFQRSFLTDGLQYYLLVKEMHSLRLGIDGHTVTVILSTIFVANVCLDLILNAKIRNTILLAL